MDTHPPGAQPQPHGHPRAPCRPISRPHSSRSLTHRAQLPLLSSLQIFGPNSVRCFFPLFFFLTETPESFNKAHQLQPALTTTSRQAAQESGPRPSGGTPPLCTHTPSRISADLILTLNGRLLGRDKHTRHNKALAGWLASNLPLAAQHSISFVIFFVVEFYIFFFKKFFLLRYL